MAAKKNDASRVLERFCFSPNIATAKRAYKVVNTTEHSDSLIVVLEDDFSNLVFTEAVYNAVIDSLRAQLPSKYKNKHLAVEVRNQALQNYIANQYRRLLPLDSLRLGGPRPNAEPLMRNVSKPYRPTQGLYGRHIALWASHGLYYNDGIPRWEWQRPRMFGTVEDLLSSSVVLPFLVPMLENAGATVFMPRERDIHHEGYCLRPQVKGDSLRVAASFSKPDYYRVKIWFSGHANANDSVLCVLGGGGQYQRIMIGTSGGAGTWLDVGEVYTTKQVNVSFPRRLPQGISIDSVRIGGGISRFGSGYPRFAEAALYYLRDAGLPDSLWLNQKPGVKSDYYDDLYARSRWTNYLSGGSVANPLYQGLNVPLDAVLALHTDAQITAADSVVGTLLICTTDSLLPSGQSQFASHDLAEYVRAQVLADMSCHVFERWTSRGIWHQKYVETRIPPVPSIIVEMGSHQNFYDMRYLLSPINRFIMARAIYKGVLRFLSNQYGVPYCVQPLPVTHFSTRMDADSVYLSWQPNSEPDEPSSQPEAYVVYTRVGQAAFDQGRVVYTSHCAFALPSDSLYSFKICALNKGGESFPSEILSVGRVSGELGKVLVVNGFTRVCGPDNYDTPSEAGFRYERDFGVPYLRDIAYTGRQVEFSKSSTYASNDYSGWGTSLFNYETEEVAGNSFDYVMVHGISMMHAGYSFVSCASDYLCTHPQMLASYKVVDLIFGKQRSTDGFSIYSDHLQSALFNYLKKGGGKLIVTGAYIASEQCTFTDKVLRFKLRAPWATTNGQLLSTTQANTYQLPMRPNASTLFLQSVDALQPTDKYGTVLLRYQQTLMPAVIAFKRTYTVVSAGFPFELIEGQQQRDYLMNQWLNY